MRRRGDLMGAGAGELGEASFCMPSTCGQAQRRAGVHSAASSQQQAAGSRQQAAACEQAWQQAAGSGKQGAHRVG